MAGGRLQGYGVHDLDLLIEAFGEVDSVAAATEVGVGERPVRRTARRTRGHRRGRLRDPGFAFAAAASGRSA